MDNWLAEIALPLARQTRAWVPVGITHDFDEHNGRLALSASPPGCAVFEFQAFAALDNEGPERRATTVANAFLNFIQDFIVRSLAEAWPVAADGSLVLPSTVVRDGVLEASLGDGYVVRVKLRL